MLDKIDTSYMTMNYVIGLQYSFQGNNYLKAYFDYASSSILSADLLVVDNENLDFADYKKTMYGVEFLYRKLDYLYNPRKGYSLLLNASAGNRKIVKNSKVDDIIYDGIEMNTLRYRVLGDVTGYIPLHKKWVVLLAAKGGALMGSDNLVNELFKIGGFNTLRGFNENEIYASSYLIGLAELRFVYAKRSYINAFFNLAWYEKNITGNYSNDTPFGFGVGTAFDTKAGMFYLMYALGRQYDNPISLKSGIIHFGIKVNF
jgi:hemolysin activation/secretion protein